MTPLSPGLRLVAPPPPPPPLPVRAVVAPVRLPSAADLEAQARTETHRCVLVPQVSFAGVDLTAELRKPGSTATLKPIQSEALAAIRACGGLLAPIGVGHGKTLVSLLAGTVLGVSAVLVLTKAGVVDQMLRDFDHWKDHFRMVPTMIRSYSTLSRPESTRLLEDLAKRFVTDRQSGGLALVCDEAHALKHQTSARTKRVIRFMQSHPQVRFVALSGTITSKSVRDYAHLSELALRHLSPVPRDQHHVDAWAEAFDADGKPGEAEWAQVRPVLDAFGEPGGEWLRGEDRKSWARRALQRRLRTAPGVVMTDETSIGCSLVIHTIEDLAVPREIVDALDHVESDQCDPQGDQIPDDATRWRIARQLTAGFFYRWVWPEGKVDWLWLEARRDWHRHVRAELEHRSRAGYDSPLLVWNHVAREVREADAEGRKLDSIQRAWVGWHGQKHKPAPPTVWNWIDTYLVEHAAAWARAQVDETGKPMPVILWYETRAVGEALRLLGLPVYGQGVEIPADRPHTCAASIRVHGTGRNLQAWSRQLVVEPPSSGETWEQLLGRTHRQGQTADEVEVWVYHHAAAFRQALKTARRDARYIEDTTGNVQKLNFATWSKEA